MIGIASIFIYAYQTPRDRSPSVTITCIFAITTLLATVMLLPADVALVSSTSLPKLGRRKDWATQDEVDTITFSLTIVYYFLYSLDAFLCLILIPFTYFWYEEYDELGEQSTGQRFWNALKYTLCFIAIVSVLFLVGFFAPVSKNRDDVDLDYFRRLLMENRKDITTGELGKFHASSNETDQGSYRWRTRLNICTRSVNNHRRMRLCSVHLFRACAFTGKTH